MREVSPIGGLLPQARGRPHSGGRTDWRGGLVKVQNANTAAPDGEPQFTGWCLDKEDLCVTKLCAFREKDQNFVAASCRSALVDRETILSRLTAVDERYQPSSRAGRLMAPLAETGNPTRAVAGARNGSQRVQTVAD